MSFSSANSSDHHQYYSLIVNDIGSWDFSENKDPQNPVHSNLIQNEISKRSLMQNDYNLDFDVSGIPKENFLDPLMSRSANSVMDQTLFCHQNLSDQNMKPMNQGCRLSMVQQNQIQQQLPAAQRTKSGNEDVLVVELEQSLFSRGKPRIRWTVELHERFLRAVSELGGLFSATPNAILQKIKVKGMNLDHIKSHLQKMRIRNPSDRIIEETAISLKQVKGEGCSIGLTSGNMSALESYIADINSYGRLLRNSNENLKIETGEGSENIQDWGLHI